MFLYVCDETSQTVSVGHAKQIQIYETMNNNETKARKVRLQTGESLLSDTKHHKAKKHVVKNEQRTTIPKISKVTRIPTAPVTGGHHHPHNCRRKQEEENNYNKYILLTMIQTKKLNVK